MKLFNPSPDMIPAKFDGVNYYVLPQCKIDVPTDTGAWIMERFAQFGLVDITISDPEKLSDPKRFIIEKTLEGLDKFLEHLYENQESWVQLDTEMKAQNTYGTVLKHKKVRELLEKVELTTTMINDIEKRFNIFIKRANTHEKVTHLGNTIDQLIKEFEADVDVQAKVITQQKEMDSFVDNIIPEIMNRRAKKTKTEDQPVGA